MMKVEHYNKKLSNGPCLHCEYREINCRSKCRSYKEWRKELIEWKAKCRKEKYKDRYCIEFKIDQIIKYKRSH